MLMAGTVVLFLLATGCASTGELNTPGTLTTPPASSLSTTIANPTNSPSVAGSQAPIKVGALYPLSGTDAINGENMQKGHDQAIKEINAQGGIDCLGGRPLQMVYGDSRGTAEAGISETERLINQEQVVVMMGAYHSSVTIPATVVSNKYKIPWIDPNALAAEITSRGLYYVFMTTPTLEQWAHGDAQFAYQMGGRTAVILVPNFAFGTEGAEAWNKHLPEEGFKILGSYEYQFGAADFSSAILQVKAKDPDVLFLLANTTDAIHLTQQMKAMNYYPKMAIVNLGGGFTNPDYVLSVGAHDAEGIIVTSDWFPNENLPGATEFTQKFKDETGILPTGLVNTTYASTWLLHDILEEACSLDGTVIADTMHNTTFTPWPETRWVYQWSQVSFEENGQLKQAQTVIAQYQDGNQVTVYPSELAVAQPIWPVSGWGQRD
jgi:branched-chain amino acid transport system substrate-binding protein